MTVTSGPWYVSGGYDGTVKATSTEPRNRPMGNQAKRAEPGIAHLRAAKVRMQPHSDRLALADRDDCNKYIFP